MELQLELELEWELKWKLEWEMELQPHKPRELQLAPPQNPGLGPKRRFEALEAIPAFTFGGFWGHFQNPKMGHPPPATSYTITVFTRGFSSKVDFQGTLGSHSTCRPPNFH